MKEEAGKILVVLLALFFGLGIAFELFYTGNCTALEYLSKEIINFDATTCGVETAFSRAG